MNHQLDSL